MVHLESYIKSLKLSWFRRILQSTDDLLNTRFRVITKITVSKLLQIRSDYPRDISKIIHNLFWKESLLAFSEYVKIVQKTLNIQQTPVWFNPQIKMDRKSICFEVFYKKGLIYVSDILNEDGEFIQLNDFNVNLPFTIILGLKRVLCLVVNNVNEWYNTLPILPRSITILLKCNKDVYNVFIRNCHTFTSVKHEEKWKTLLNLDD